MGKIRFASDERVHVGLVICVCFLFTSTGWFSWLYRVMELDASAPVDLITMVFGYIMQALGIGIYLLIVRRPSAPDTVSLIMGTLVLHIASLVPATLVGGAAVAIGAGLLSNIPCGIIQGAYLTLLAEFVEPHWRGTVFGYAYAASTLFTWLLSLPMHGMLTRGMPCFVACCLMAIATLALLRAMPGTRGQFGARVLQEGRTLVFDGLLFLAAAAVVMASLVKTAGFSSPAEDLSAGVNIELSRILYGCGLVVAGLSSDHDRRLGMLCCAVALVMPFLMLALSGAGVSGTTLWALGYFLTGFYVLFRVLLMGDLADRQGWAALASLGLMFGRVGDAMGTALSMALAHQTVVLIMATAGFFVVTMGIFFKLYQRLYLTLPMPEPVRERSESEVFETFAARCGLTARERDVLRLVLAERSNAEIAGELFVSEATVKYHMGNLLKKTGCRNRLEVLAEYAQSR